MLTFVSVGSVGSGVHYVFLYFYVKMGGTHRMTLCWFIVALHNVRNHVYHSLEWRHERPHRRLMKITSV